MRRRPYHRGFEQAMLKVQVPITKVNPLHARRFAEAIGRLAKTDHIEAAMLAKMGTTIDVRLVEASDQDMDELKELNLSRRWRRKNGHPTITFQPRNGQRHFELALEGN